MPHFACLSLGTNLGDRLANLTAARSALAALFETIAFSSIYETEPWGYTNQPPFLNQAAAGATALAPLDLLHSLKAVESRLGRQPGFRYGPRLIDIDILLYDDLVLDTPQLAVPHPRLAGRAFALIPLLELAPGAVHPVLHQTIRQLASQVDSSPVRKIPASAAKDGLQ